MKYTKAQRFVAIVGIILLVALYLIAMISAFFKSPLAQSIFMTALFCTFFIPVIIFLFQFFTKKKGDNKEDDIKS